LEKMEKGKKKFDLSIKPKSKTTTSNVEESSNKSDIVKEILAAKPIEKEEKETESIVDKVEASEDAICPKNWKNTWKLIEEMRKTNKASVDTLGCDALCENEDPKVFRYQLLISMMLSSQTTDPITAKVVNNLKEHGLTIPNILQTSEEKIYELVYSVRFNKQKAKNVKKSNRNTT